MKKEKEIAWENLSANYVHAERLKQDWVELEKKILHLQSLKDEYHEVL